MPRAGVDAKLAFLVEGPAQQLLGDLDGQAVGRQVVGDVGAPPVRGLDVGAIAADPHVDAGAAEREGGQAFGVDVTELGDEGFQALRDVAVGAAVEVGQDLQPLRLAAGDLVEERLKLRGEGVVH